MLLSRVCERVVLYSRIYNLHSSTTTTTIAAAVVVDGVGVWLCGMVVTQHHTHTHTVVFPWTMVVRSTHLPRPHTHLRYAVNHTLFYILTHTYLYIQGERERECICFIYTYTLGTREYMCKGLCYIRAHTHTHTFVIRYKAINNSHH